MIYKHNTLHLAAVIVLAVGFTVGFYKWWPCETVFDDGGIVLKYIDNFEKGLFYHYNAEDGPVFGISSFTHGILAGGLAWSGLFSPEHAVAASNIVGMALLNIMLLLILLHFNRSLVVALPVWLLVLFSSRYLLVCTFQGLETPLHGAIVLGTYLAFLKGYRKCLWGLSALAIISKLDAVPVVGVLLLMDGCRSVYAGGGSWPVALRDLRRLALWFLLPLGVWVIFSIVVFGSPLPHTAQAKMGHHRDMSGLLCPFLLQWFTGDTFRLTCVALASACFAGCYTYFRKPIVQWVETLGFALGVMGLMALYFVYNPNEKMPWYYALPELLVFLQGGVLIAVGLKAVRDRWGRWMLRACVVGVFLLAGLAGFSSRPDLWRTISYVNAIETERIAVGQWIRANSKPTDRLMTPSGHIARSSGLYCYDQTGLNSEIVLKRWGEGLLGSLRPDWTASHGLLPVHEQRALGYELAHSAYNIATEGQFPAFRVFRKVAPGTPEIKMAYPVTGRNVLTDEATDRGAYGSVMKVKGRRIWLTGLAGMCVNGKDPELVFGAKKTVVPLKVSIVCCDTSWSVIEKKDMEIEARNRRDHVNGYSEEIRCPLAVGGGVEVVMVEVHDPVPEGVALEIVDPIIVVTEAWDAL